MAVCKSGSGSGLTAWGGGGKKEKVRLAVNRDADARGSERVICGCCKRTKGAGDRGQMSYCNSIVGYTGVLGQCSANNNISFPVII